MTDRREDVKTVRIPIEESIFTYGSGYEIGSRLRECQNIARNYVRSSGTSVPNFAKVEVPVTNSSLLNPAAQNPAGVGVFAAQGQAFFLVGAEEVAGAHPRHVYDLTTAQALPVTGTSLGNSASPGIWSFAFAPNFSEPLTFVTCSGAAVKKKIRIVASNPTVTDWVPSPFNPDSPATGFEARPSFLYYHLNRIWLGYVSTQTRRTLVFYTDPFNENLIRGTSFLDIPDICHVAFRASASDLDIGTVPRLFFAGTQGIFVLEGDPTLGNANFRQIKKTLGTKSSLHVAEILDGAVIIGTDGKLYYIPTGSLNFIPINLPIRDKLTNFSTPGLMLGWRNPYLYFFLGATGGFYLADLSKLPNEVYWTGPHLNSSNGGKATSAFISDVPVDVLGNLSNYLLMGFTASELADFSDVEDVTQQMKTGFIYEPDSDVVFKRAKFKIKRIGSAQTFTFAIGNEEGVEVNTTFTIPSIGSPTQDTIAHALVTLPPDAITAGTFFYATLHGDGLYNIIDWQIEYRVVPRKD